MSAETMQTQLSEVDNRSRKTDERIAELESALGEMEQAMFKIADAINRSAMNDLRSQVIEETITRYLAGYEVGDFTKEVEQAQNGTAKSPKDFKYLVKDKNFDQDRFNNLAEEITKILLDAAKKANDERRAQAGVASGKIVPMNKEPRIILK